MSTEPKSSPHAQASEPRTRGTAGITLVTGCAGFIGMHCAERLLARGDTVVGLDNLNAYYDPALKQARLARLSSHTQFRFEPLDLADRAYLLETGQIVLSGSATEIKQNDAVRRSYLGY